MGAAAQVSGSAIDHCGAMNPCSAIDHRAALHPCTAALITSFSTPKRAFWNKLPTLASPPFLWEGGEAIGAEDINAGGGMVFKCNELLKEMMSLNPEAFPVV